MASVPLTVEEVAALIVGAARPVSVERVSLAESLDRVLRTDAISRILLPPWDNASMDGFAVRAADVERASTEAPVTLPVAATVAAGGDQIDLPAGCAIRIMTGAPVPRGSDSVIRVEDTNGGVDRVEIRDARDARRNIRSRGEDVAPGQVAAEAGTVLGPAQLGVLASIGMREVEVSRAPRVAILATGDEVVDLDRFDEVAAGKRIVSSNSYSIGAAVARAGAVPHMLPLAGDSPDALRERLRPVLDHDLIVTSGGVSVGAFDFTRAAIRALGGSILVDRVRMRPGAPLGFGVIGNALWLGLPGNPVSALITFELFGRPLLRRLRGERALFPMPIPVVVDEEISLAAPLTHFLRVVVSSEGGVLHARLTGSQGSGLLTSVSRANAVLVVPHDRPVVRAGETASALVFGNHALLSPTFHL